LLAAHRSCCDLGPNYIALDHDQRETLNTASPQSARAHVVLDQCLLWLRLLEWPGRQRPRPVPRPISAVHTTFDVSAGHAFGERWRLSASVLNVTNHRVLLDNSITIGGFHFNDPRLISAELRYRFHFEHSSGHKFADIC